MGFHTFDADRTVRLDDLVRFRFVSREELSSHLGVMSERVVADPGSGIGPFTGEVALHVDTLCAVDVQVAIHDYYRGRGALDNVEFITAGVASFPFDDDHFDAVFPTMTYHESATDEALVEPARVVHPGGIVVVIDWSTSGSGEDGPP